MNNLVDYGLTRLDDYAEIYLKVGHEHIPINKAKLCGLIKTMDRITEYPGQVSRVIFSAPATIVFWSDGTKTIVKAYDEPFDKEKGLAMAICKKYLGKAYKPIFNKWAEGSDE